MHISPYLPKPIIVFASILKKRFAKHTKHTANKLLNYFAIIKYYLINKMPL